jgi:hypothetical protein
MIIRYGVYALQLPVTPSICAALLSNVLLQRHEVSSRCHIISDSAVYRHHICTSNLQSYITKA